MEEEEPQARRAKVTNATVAKAALVLAFFPSSFLLPSVVWRRNRPSHESQQRGGTKKRKVGRGLILFFFTSHLNVTG